MYSFVTLLVIIFVIIGIIYLSLWLSHHNPTPDICADYPEIIPRVVVSFSTIPSRMGSISDVIKNLENQTFTPDAVYFNLPYKSLREEKDYPDFVVPDTHLNVIVNRCEDIGPLTKLSPTLEKEKDPETIIITIDDDIIYQDHVLEKLVKAIASSQKTVYSYGGWNYTEWSGFGKKGSNIIPFYTLQGVEHIIHGIAGVAYKRKFFDDDFHQVDACFTCDDVLISSYLSLHGITMIKLNNQWCKRRISNDITLLSVNLKELPYSSCIKACRQEWCKDKCINYADKVCYPNGRCEEI